MSRGRVEAEATCPYCGESGWYSFHVCSDSLICNSCDMEFEIDLDVEVKITDTRTIN